MQLYKSLKIVIQALASVFLVMQMRLAVQKYLEKPTMSSPGTKPLSSLTKPLLVAVCRSNQLNYSRSNSLGYNTGTDFFSGQTNNGTVLSWTGNHENMTFDETINYMYKPELDNFEFLATKGNISHRLVFPHGLCKVYEGEPIRYFEIKFRSLEKHSEYFVIVTDPAAANLFQMPSSLMTGDKTTIKVSSAKKYIDYSIQLEESTIDLDDGSCVQYPNQKHASYSDCVDDELRGKILPILGCMVPWMTRKDHCSDRFQQLPKHEALIDWLYNVGLSSWGGIQYHADFCPFPCTLLSAHSTFQQSIENIQVNSLCLHFKDHIEVEEIVLAYDSTSLLVEIGSCLGLWLGLSVVGVYDITVLAVYRIKNLFETLA